MEQPWLTFVNSLSPNFVNRTVEVVGGNYSSESLYDLSFSNGDIIRIVDLVPTDIKADLFEYGKKKKKKLKTISIPPSYEGLFHLIPDPEPFATVADLMQSVRLVKKSEMQPIYQNKIPIYSAGKESKIGKDETLALISIEERGVAKYLQCRLTKRPTSPTVFLPVNCTGMFVECQDDEHYIIDTIVNWKILTGRKRRLKPSMENPMRFDDSHIIPHNFNGYLVLHPGFSVKAILEGGNTMLIPSHLDITVVDFPGTRNPKTLSEAMTISEIYNVREEAFPLLVRVVDIKKRPKSTEHLQCTRGQCLKILRKESVHGFFISEDSEMLLKKRCFFVPDTYQGIAIKQSRDFTFVYDVVLEKMTGREIQFMACRDYISEANQLSSFRSGEKFRTIKMSMVTAQIEGTPQDIEVLECERIETKSIVRLPFYAQGQFKEVIDDKSKYTIKQLVSESELPCYIKVVCQDPSLSLDPLCAIPKLRIDRASREDCLVAQHMESAEATFRIAVNQMKMLVCIIAEDYTKSNHKAGTSSPSVNIVEISELQYQSVVGCDYENIYTPPPLPPRTKHLCGGKVRTHSFLEKDISASSISQSNPHHSLGNMSHDSSSNVQWELS